ncbi:hypothetical protein LTR86_008045 [Recurvomyces mirabilis]|nr:hypothetical protein LTR86_008045 [Recurvomyces mirabilis]
MASAANANDKSGTALYYTEHNTEQATSIIFIQGAGGDGQDWLPIAKLMPKYHTILPDLPAHGKSFDIKPFSKELSARLLAELIRKHAHNGKAHVIGLSLGAFVAVELATAYPDVVLDMFVSGLKCLPPNLATGFGSYVAFAMGRLESVVPISVVRWLMDGAEIRDPHPEQSHPERTRAIMLAISRPEHIPPWPARTCIIAAGKAGILPTSDTPADAMMFRDAGRKGNAETVAYTHALMRHPWHLITATMAAEPILASSIWRAKDHSPPARPKDQRLATGLHKLDEALDGGLPYGGVNCISTENGCDSSQISHHALVSHLTSSATATATVIDSTLSFDLRKLHGRLKHTLQKGDGNADAAMDVLRRLNIMKVFDFVGLTEAVSEVREALDSHARSMNPSQVPAVAPRGTIGDSQDDEEEEMLDVLIPPQPDPEDQSEPYSNLLIIDNIAQLATPLLKNNHVQGQALLTNFMRSLSHTTKVHNLCTLLVNGTTSYAQSKEETPSIFASCLSRPALGRTFGYGLDMHLLVHAVPKTGADARAEYGGRSGGRNGLSVEFANVVEVLQDRSGSCVGRWAAFTVNENGDVVEM